MKNKFYQRYKNWNEFTDFDLFFQSKFWQPTSLIELKCFYCDSIFVTMVTSYNGSSELDAGDSNA